jgi:hypothetical protein
VPFARRSIFDLFSDALRVLKLDREVEPRQFTRLARKVKPSTNVPDLFG